MKFMYRNVYPDMGAKVECKIEGQLEPIVDVFGDWPEEERSGLSTGIPWSKVQRWWYIDQAYNYGKLEETYTNPYNITYRALQAFLEALVESLGIIDLLNWINERFFDER